MARRVRLESYKRMIKGIYFSDLVALQSGMPLHQAIFTSLTSH